MKQKSELEVSFCNRMKLVLLLLWLIGCTATLANAAEPVGIFLEDVKGCSFSGGGESDLCLKGAFLRPGDIIQYPGGIRKLPIQWQSEESTRFENVGKHREKIIFTVTTPKGKSALESLIRFFHSRTVFTQTATSRRIGHGPETMLSDRSVELIWCTQETARLSIQDENGKELFYREITGATSTVIPAGVLNLKPGNTYFWELTGVKEFSRQRLILLPQEEEQQITVNLALASEGFPEPIAALRRALYLAHLTSLDSQRTNFNWLIYGELQPVVAKLDEENRMVANFLLRRSGYERCR
jgi:hypothetical protein